MVGRSLLIRDVLLVTDVVTAPRGHGRWLSARRVTTPDKFYAQRRSSARSSPVAVRRRLFSG
jgi:hypothetical protein